MGNGNEASGNISISMGVDTLSKSFSEIAIGLQNTDYTPTSSTAFEPIDRLFVVGNGNRTQSDAFTILKNAKTSVAIDSFEQTTNMAKLQVNGVVSTSISKIDTVLFTYLDETNTTSIILLDNSNNDIDLYLPNPSTFFYKNMSGRLTLKLVNSDYITFSVSIFPYDSEKIDGDIKYEFSHPYERIELVTDGVNWWIVSNKQ